MDYPSPCACRRRSAAVSVCSATQRLSASLYARRSIDASSSPAQPRSLQQRAEKHMSCGGPGSLALAAAAAPAAALRTDDEGRRTQLLDRPQDKCHCTGASISRHERPCSAGYYLYFRLPVVATYVRRADDRRRTFLSQIERPAVHASSIFK